MFDLCQEFWVFGDKDDEMVGGISPLLGFIEKLLCWKTSGQWYSKMDQVVNGVEMIAKIFVHVVKCTFMVEIIHNRHERIPNVLRYTMHHF